jgi:hypothetical protein
MDRLRPPVTWPHSLSRSSSEAPLRRQESGSSLIECFDISVDSRKHHRAFERGHDVDRSRLCVDSSDALRKIIDASMEKRQHLLGDSGREYARLGAKYTTKAHPPVALECRPKCGPVNGDGVFGGLVRAARDRRKKSVTVAPGHGRSQHGLGMKVMMHARARDADLGRKIAETETAISGVANMIFRQIHQAFGSCAQGTLAHDREIVSGGLKLQHNLLSESIYR